MRLIALAALLLAALVTVCDRLRLKKTMDTLERMLDEAAAGTFAAAHFDESRLSAVECKLLRYLGASGLSARRLAAQRQQVQALIADVSHQTKTPIAGILLYAGLLAEKELPAECRGCVDALCAQADKLQFLIDSLVKAGRLETGVVAVRPRAAGVRALAEAAVSAAADRAARKGVSLTCSAEEASARFDPKWTREALFNLVDNAVKYTPAGGSVALSVTPYELFCRIDVADTGAGLAEDEQGRIFERFYRAANARDAEGVGLGLYLAREIVSAEGGYIKVSSKPGKGSTFSLFLPRA